MQAFLSLVTFTFFFSILGFVIADKSSKYCHTSFLVKALVIMSAIWYFVLTYRIDTVSLCKV